MHKEKLVTASRFKQGISGNATLICDTNIPLSIISKSSAISLLAS
jgi:hypothetical protein